MIDDDHAPPGRFDHAFFAEQDGFRGVFFGLPSIGGRYSALSDFGMVPAAVMGVDVPRFLESADIMVNSCAPSVPACPSCSDRRLPRSKRCTTSGRAAMSGSCCRIGRSRACRRECR